jgi:glycine/D-amino acid oxidase-like deaminating enzyme
VPREVVRLRTDSRPYALELDDGTVVRGHTVVLATGARYRRLPLPDIARFEGAGVHYAATAIEAALCEGKEAIVVGVAIPPDRRRCSCHGTPPTCTSWSAVPAWHPPCPTIW